MLGSHFYHERIRKSVAMFGSLFNNIYVIRKDSTGKVISQAKVPLSYAPRSSYLERIRENPNLDLDTKVAIKLPRMSFEIISYQYDATRQLSKTNSINRAGNSNDSRNKFFTPVPYTIGFQLNVYAKTQDDALQIVEQIIPYFTPQYSLTIKPFADYVDIKEDVPIILNGISYSDAYEGALDQRRIINYQLDFEMHANFYGPIGTAKIIREVNVDLYTANIDSDGAFVYYDPSSTVQVLPNPLNVSADSDYGFTTNITVSE